MTYAPRSRWAESFDIFERHGLEEYDVEGRHDIIYVSCPQLLSTSEEGMRLLVLGWGKDEYFTDPEDHKEGENYSPRDEEAAWYHYT